MAGSLHLLQIVLPVFLIMGAGYAMRRARILTEDADQSLLGVLIKPFGLTLTVSPAVAGAV